jgi:aryl-alcohol dehydrogenase-like predicted oxidoreductase
MEYVNLGSTGLRVSRICLGMMSFGNDSDRKWVLDEDAAEPIMKAAADGGITFYDTANVYSGGASEVATGRLLGKLFSREQVVVATKVCMPMGPGENERGLSRKHILTEIDASLRRLDMDYVDLYQIHRWDYRTPIEETMEALHDVVRTGKARYIGASSMHAWQFAKAQYTADAHGWTRFVSMQNHYNLVYREEEREMIPQCVGPGGRGHPMESAGARPAGRQPNPRRRAADDPGRLGRVQRLAVREGRRLQRRGADGRGRRRARRPVGPARVGLAAAPARRHRPDRGHHPA